MKIAYINLIYSKSGMEGVEKKLIDEAKFYKKHGFDVYFLNRNFDGYRDNIYFKRVDNYYNGKFFELYLRTFTFNIIRDIIDLDSYDRIYLRYPLMDFSALSYAKEYGYKTVTQHHGKELEEIKEYNISTFFKIFQYFLERFYAPKFFKDIYALTAISDDLVKYEIKRVDFKNRTLRFSNGIDPKKYKIIEKSFKDDSFHILMMASTFAPWHGLDRLLNSLINYSGEVKLFIYIVGDVSKEYDNLIEKLKKQDKVKLYLFGKLDQKELDKVFNNIDLAVDSLAMYRLNMNEASTLKSKEYIARGIPFIYSAIDLDLVEISKYLYDVGNSDSLINFKEILKYYKNLDIIYMKNKMRETTLNTLSWDIKIKKLRERIFC